MTENGVSQTNDAPANRPSTTGSSWTIVPIAIHETGDQAPRAPVGQRMRSVAMAELERNPAKDQTEQQQRNGKVKAGRKIA